MSMNNTPNTFVKVAVSSVIVFTASISYGKGIADKLEGVGVGVAAQYIDHGLVNYNNEISYAPNLSTDKKSKGISPYIGFEGVNYDPKQATDESFQQLQQRDSSLFLGGIYATSTPYGNVEGSLATDVQDKSGGTLATLSYWKKLSGDKWEVYPSVGVQWQDTRYSDYYFGVSDDESNKSQIKQYTTKDSFQPYIKVKSSYTFDKNWSLFLNQDVAYYDDQQFDSPKIDQRVTTKTAVGINFIF